MGETEAVQKQYLDEFVEAQNHIVSKKVYQIFFNCFFFFLALFKLFFFNDLVKAHLYHSLSNNRI